MADGKAEALGPIARQTLAWVNRQRHGMEELRRPTPDELRRIELCARAALDIHQFNDLYGGAVDAPSADLQGQRGAPGGVPEAPEGGHGCAQPHGCCCEHCACWC